MAKRDRGDLSGAVNDFDRAIELDRKLAGAFQNRGTIKRARGDRFGAMADLDRALELKQPAP